MRTPLRVALPVCGRILGKCPTDPHVLEKINEAQQRLLPMGKWVGTYQHYRFCASSGCVTLPRQLETLETAAICNWPVAIRNEWFQYVRDGFGLQSECVSAPQDKGEGWPAFDDVAGDNKVLRVYSDTPEAVGATILLQFWNQNRIPVRTEYPAGTWIDGERVAISTIQTNSVNFCMPNGLVAVQKPITNGTVFLYEYDTVLLTQRLLAIYEPDETIPNYRRYVIPFAANSSTTISGCGSQVVDVIAKRRFIPAMRDDDWLLIGNVGALKMACKAIQKEENNLIDEAFKYWSLAKGLLDDELNQFIGDGMQAVPQLMDEFSNGAVSDYCYGTAWR